MRERSWKHVPRSRKVRKDSIMTPNQGDVDVAKSSANSNCLSSGEAKHDFCVRKIGPQGKRKLIRVERSLCTRNEMCAIDISQQSCHLLSKEMVAQRDWVLGLRAQSSEVVEMRSAYFGSPSFHHTISLSP